MSKLKQSLDTGFLFGLFKSYFINLQKYKMWVLSHCNSHTNSEAWPKKIEIRLWPCKINCFQNSLGKKRAHYDRDKTTFLKNQCRSKSIKL